MFCVLLPRTLSLSTVIRLCFQSRQHAFFFAWHQKDEAFALAFISCGSADPVNIGFRVFRSVDLQDPSTDGKSKPRAAISVANNTECLDVVNLLYILRRASVFACHAGEGGDTGMHLAKGFVNERTCLQLERKTRTLDCRCDLMKLQSNESFWSNVQTRKCCDRFSGVAIKLEASLASCMPTWTGSFKLSRARSLTDWV